MGPAAEPGPRRLVGAGDTAEDPDATFGELEPLLTPRVLHRFIGRLDRETDDLLAHRLIQSAIERRFGAFHDRPSGAFPVGLLDSAVQRWLIAGVSSRVVRMPARIMRKQKGDKGGFDGHPDLRLPDYHRLPSLVAEPGWVTRPELLPHYGRKTRERIKARLILLKGIEDTSPRRCDLLVVDPQPETGAPEVTSFYTIPETDLELLTGARAREVLRQGVPGEPATLRQGAAPGSPAGSRGGRRKSATSAEPSHRSVG